MPSEIKAIVFRTPQLEATRLYFESVLEFRIKEASATHFVIHSKSIRLVFLKSKDEFETQLYVNETSNEISGSNQTFESASDPNGIKIIRVFNHHQNQS